MVGDDWVFLRSRVQLFPKGSRKPVKINSKAQKVGLVFSVHSNKVSFRLIGLVRVDCSFTHFHIKKIDCARFREGVVSLSLSTGEILFLHDCVPISLRDFVHALGSVGVHGAFRRPPAMPNQISRATQVPKRDMFEALDDDSLKIVVSFASQTSNFKMVCSRFAQIIAEQRSVLNLSRLAKSKVLLASEDVVRLVSRHCRLSVLDFGCYPHVSLLHLRQISEQGCFKNLKALNLNNVRKLSDSVASSLLMKCEQLESLSFIDCPKVTPLCLTSGISSNITSLKCGSSTLQSSNAIDERLFDQMVAADIRPVVIELKNCSNISNLQRLTTYCGERIRHLELSNAENIPSDQFVLLRLLPKSLQCLDLSNSPLSDIQFVSNFDLQYICLAGCILAAADICDVLPKCQHLRVVDLSSCRSVDRFVIADVFSIPSLTALAVNDCPRLAEDTFSTVDKCFGDLQAVAVGGTGLEFPMFAWLANHLHQCGASPEVQVRHSIIWREYIEVSFEVES